jgi:hypothetical protein
MYDKHGCVLRVETVLNDPYEFKVRRRAGRRGQRTLGWHPLPKGVAFLPRYATVSAAANHRYQWFEWLAIIVGLEEERRQRAKNNVDRLGRFAARFITCPAIEGTAVC